MNQTGPDESVDAGDGDSPGTETHRTQATGPLNPSSGADPLEKRYQRLLDENFALREKVRNLEEDIEALHWELKLRRLRTPWRELPAIGRRLRRGAAHR